MRIPGKFTLRSGTGFITKQEKKKRSLTMIKTAFALSLLACGTSAIALAADAQPVNIRFRAQVGDREFACGKTYEGVGTTKTRLNPRDFRFYVQSVDLLDENGAPVPVSFTADSKWQTERVSLLDFEDGTGKCLNGTPETNDRIAGTVAPGHYKGVRFTLGVPFEDNHQELTTLPSPLNITALSWVWNAGHKFARIEFTTTGLSRGYFLHLGSTGCTPNTTKLTIPTQCAAPNRVDVTLADFNPETDVIVADLAELFKDVDLDSGEKQSGGCMSSPKDAACAPVFRQFGLPFGSQPAGQQTFFRKAYGAPPVTAPTPVAARP
jgi:uncharacterized repeat protein (TIGR04052 family)